MSKCLFILTFNFKIDAEIYHFDNFRIEVDNLESVLLVLRPVFGQQHGLEHVGLVGHDALVAVERLVAADDVEVREGRIVQEGAHVQLQTMILTTAPRHFDNLLTEILFRNEICLNR